MLIRAYLLGSIPTGYLVARAKGIDIRTVGSGNIGATNVFRILGNSAGIFVLVFDGLKGFAGCAWLVDAVILAFPTSPEATEYLRLIAGLAVLLGNGARKTAAGGPAQRHIVGTQSATPRPDSPHRTE